MTEKEFDEMFNVFKNNCKSKTSYKKCPLGPCGVDAPSNEYCGFKFLMWCESNKCEGDLLSTQT